MFSNLAQASLRRGQKVAANVRNVSVSALPLAQSSKGVAALVAAGVAAGMLMMGNEKAHSVSTENVHPPHLPWSFQGFGQAIDKASVRRGFEVYRQVCSTCHSLDYVKYRHLVGVIYTKEQATALANKAEITDGPNEEGEMYTRPGKLFDAIPSPYPNDETARLANNGALPPDLSLVLKARHGQEDYVYSLLTGYKEAPAGVVVREGMYYNPYFLGGLMGMAPPLSDGQVEYEDDTPATVSQMAKDVTTFLKWSSYPEHDERQKAGFKWLPALAVAFLFAGYHKRLQWSSLKNRKVRYV